MDRDQPYENSARPDALAAAESRNDRSPEDSSFALLRDNVIEALRILLLRRWAFFIPFCLVACLGTVASHWLPRTYQSTTIIERRDHPVLMQLRQTAATGGFARFFRPTLMRDLKSLTAMTEVVERLNLVEGAPREADGSLTEEGRRLCRARAATLVGGVSARLVQKTEHFDQIRITFEGSAPGLPQQIVNEVKNTYICGTRTKLTDMLTEAKGYFDNLARKEREKIAELDEELSRFRAEYIGIDPTNPGALKMKLTSLETERSELRREITTLEREVETRKRTMAHYMESSREPAVPRRDGAVQLPRVAKSGAAQALEDEIAILHGEIRDLRLERRMTERHPDIVEHRQRIARLRQRLKAQYLADARALPANRGADVDQPSSPADEAPVAWHLELAGVQMDIQDRIGRLESARSRLRVIEEDVAKHTSLEANVFRYRKEYKRNSDLLDQTRTDYNSNTRRAQQIASILTADESERGISFTELTPPTGCTKPIKPAGLAVLVLSLLAGLAAGAVCVLLQELFDQMYHTTRQVTRSLGLAILETVDEIVTSADRARQFRRQVIYAPVLVTVLLCAVGVSCGAAFMSLERPQTYERLMRVPTSVWGRISDGKLVADGVVEVGTPAAAMAPEKAGPPDAPPTLELTDGTQAAAPVRPAG